MKKYYILALGLFAALVSCNKDAEEVIAPENNPSAAPLSFVVSSPETKTTLDGLHVRWAAGDEIRVYGHNTDADTYTDNAVYELTAGAGDGTATFTLKDGETGLSGTYDEYYAVYPGSQTLTFSGTPLKMQITKLAKEQTAVENGFNPSFAIMTATYNGSRLVFHHGAGYIKFVLSEDSVTKVSINLGANCLVQQPTYVASDGSYSSGASGYSTVNVTGSFVKGSAYYVPVIPRPDDASKKITNLTISCTGGSNFTTSHFNGKVVEVGKVFDLGTLSKGPSFSASNVTIESDETGGAIDFTVSNLVDGGAVTKEVLAGATLANLSVGAVSFNTTTGEGSVSFTCDENDDEDNAKTATVRLTYTYDTDKTVTKDVVITQKKASPAGANVYDIYVSGGALVQRANGVTGASYFTKGDDTSFITSWHTDYSVTSADIGGTTYSQAIKFDSKGKIQFTVSSDVTATVRFYCVRRKSTETTATMKVRVGTIDTTTADQATVSPEHTSVTDSGDINLTAGTTYTIQQGSKESAVFYIVVTETPAS